MKIPAPLQKSLDSAKANLLPGMALWLLASLIVVTYYTVDAARPIFDVIASIKQRYGIAYSLVATSLFGGVIPAVYVQLSSPVSRRQFGRLLLFGIFLWGYRGLEVDILYGIQAMLFGTEVTFPVVAKKVVVDQFVVNPLWMGPTTILVYLWKESDFSISRASQRLSWRFFGESLPAVLFSTWIVWVPSVAIIYSLPLQLQVPLFNLVICFFVLLLTHLTRREPDPEPETAG